MSICFVSKTRLLIFFLAAAGLLGVCSQAQAVNTSIFSVSVWVNPATSVASKAIMGKAEEMRVATDATGHPLCQIKAASWQAAAVSTSAIAINQWSHIACTYDLITFKIYINGVLQGAQPLVSVADDTASAWQLGRDTSASSPYGYFTGLIDDYKFYTYALSLDQIKLLYNRNAAMTLGSDPSRNSNGTTVTGAAKDYCIPGDTAQCDKPVGEWKMDEKVAGDAKTLYDTSGNGNNGTTHWGANASGMDCTVPGKYGSGCGFDGVDDYVDCGNSSQLGMSDDMTMSAWVYPTNLDSGRRGVVMQRRQGYSLILISGDGNSAYLAYEGMNEASSWTNNFFTSTRVINKNTWSFITLSFRKDGLAELFVNGNIVATKTMVGGHSPNVPEGFLIGYDSAGGWGTPPYFSGKIDDVRIFNYARTPAQIAWDFNRGKPVAEWRFDEGSGPTVHDEGVSLNNGTITGATWQPASQCKVGKCLSFDGANNYVGISTAITGINAVSLWIKPNSTTQSILDLDGGSHKISISGGAVTATGFTSYYVDGNLNGTIADTAWHHIVAITGTTFNSTSSFYLGRIGSTYFAGKIDDVKVLRAKT